MAEYYSTPGTQAVDIPKYYANWDEEFWVWPLHQIKLTKLH